MYAHFRLESNRPLRRLVASGVVFAVLGLVAGFPLHEVLHHSYDAPTAAQSVHSSDDHGHAGLIDVCSVCLAHAAAGTMGSVPSGTNVTPAAAFAAIGDRSESLSLLLPSSGDSRAPPA